MKPKQASEILFEIGRTIGVNGDLSSYMESLTDAELSTLIIYLLVLSIEDSTTAGLALLIKR